MLVAACRPALHYKSSPDKKDRDCGLFTAIGFKELFAVLKTQNLVAIGQLAPGGAIPCSLEERQAKRKAQHGNNVHIEPLHLRFKKMN